MTHASMQPPSETEPNRGPENRPVGGEAAGGRHGRIHLYRKTTEYILFALVLAIPSVFTTRMSHALYLKTTIFNLGVMAMTILWLLERLQTNRWDLVRSPLYRPILAMLGIGLLSMLVSGYKYATVSEMLRQIGYAAFFLIVLDTIRERVQFDRLVKVILAGAIIPCIYGVIQLLHLDWLNWIPEPSWKRLLGTFANATYFAAYLVTLLPLGIALLTAPRQDRSSMKGSLALAVLVLLMATCLIYTYARGAWLGFLFVLFLQVTLAAFWLKGRNKLRILIPTVALCLPLAVALVLPGTWSVVERAKSSFTADPSNIQRALTWEAAFRLFKSHPVLGSGPGTFLIYAPSYQSPEFLRTGAVMAAHAHNEFLEVGADTGVLGLLAFLWLLVTYFWFGLKGLRQVKDTRWRLIMAGLLGGVTAFFIYNQAGVTLRMTAGATFYWLFLALTGSAVQIGLQSEEKRVATVNNATGAGSADSVTVADVSPRPLPSWARRSLYALISLAALFGTIYNARMLVSEFYAKEASNLAGANMYAEAGQEYEKAIRLNPFEPGPYYQLGHIYASLGEPNRSLKVYLRLGQLAPNYARLRYNLGRVYSSLNDFEKAREQLRLAAKFDDLPTSWLHLGLVEAKLGYLREAKEHVYRALKGDKTLDGVAPHTELAWAFRKAEKLTEAVGEFEKALQFNPDDYRLHTNLGTAYLDAGMIPQALREYQEAIRLNPRDALAYANLAALYTEQGKPKMALQMWKKVSLYAEPDSELARRAQQMLAGKTGAR